MFIVFSTEVFANQKVRNVINAEFLALIHHHLSYALSQFQIIHVLCNEYGCAFV